MITYAVPADLAASPWNLTTVPEADAERLIGYASRLIRRATVTALYTADTAGLPTDVALREAMRDATCSQVVTWVALAIDPAKGAADGGKVIAAKSLGSASVQYSVYASTVEARARAASRLSQDAALILTDAGLTGTSPAVYG